MSEYIEREATYEDFEKCNSENPKWTPSRVKTLISRQKAADVGQVRPGRWELTVHSFYSDTFDESCELCVYIVANCSECSGNHPNSYQVFSKTIYAPEDAGDDFRLDQKEEENKALQEFQRINYQFAYY